MKKIYWFIQQTEQFGGTEMVSLQILASLAPYYDITLVLTSSKPSSYIYPLPDNVKIKCLNYKMDEIRMDYYFKKYLSKHQYFKAVSLYFRFLNNVLFKRFITRKKIKKFTSKEDILIATSFDNYLLMPRKRNVFFHYHFNDKFFLQTGEKFSRLFMRTPDKYIFLCKNTLKNIVNHYPKYEKISTYALNPVRFKARLNLQDNNNQLIYVGRFMYQKNVMFLLRAMLELKEMGDKFVLHMYGDGPYLKEMQEFINVNKLEDYIIIHDSTLEIEKAYQNKDLLLLSSLYEGFPLVMLEANSQSVPVVSTNWSQAIYEMIDDGVNGYIVKEYDEKKYALTVHNALKDREKLKELKQNAYDSSKKYSIENVAKYWKEEILK